MSFSNTITIDQPDIPSGEIKLSHIESLSRDIEMSELPSKQNKCASVLTLSNPKKILYPIYFLVLVVLSPLLYACVTAATVAILPLFIASFVLARLIQLVIRSENVEKNFVVKFLMRYWMFAVVVMLLLEVGVFYPIAKYVTWFKLPTLVGLSITKWIEIICMLIGIYLLSQVVWLLTVQIISSIGGGKDGTATLVLEVVSDIIGCVLFGWAESVVMNRVPIFNQSMIFGVYTRKWIRVTLFMLIGYSIITLLTQAFVWLLPKVYGDHLGIGNIGKTIKSKICCGGLVTGVFSKRYVVYVACGLKRSIIFILSALMLLLTWVLHIGDYINTSNSTSQDKKFYNFGTWTFLSLLLWSILWLIKSCVLLYWEARAVHGRLHLRIFQLGKQLYFLVMLSRDHYYLNFENKSGNDDPPTCGSCCSDTTPPKRKVFWYLPVDSVFEEGVGEVYTLDRREVRMELIDRTDSKASVYDIQQAANIFLRAQNALSKGSILDNLHHLQCDDESASVKKAHITKVLKEIIDDVGQEYSHEDLYLLDALLQETHDTTEGITFNHVKFWMERAHNRCTCLANTLSSKKEVANCLNQILSGLIVVVIFIIWLLVTKLATIEVFVLIGTPLIGLSFIFGETCKNLFQGLIFVYIVRPYDFGDLCLIDGRLLEVKGIGVWTTTFSDLCPIDMKEVKYRNWVLSTKDVINHKSGFDWKDYIELCLTSADPDIFAKVQNEIEKLLDTEIDPNTFKKKYAKNYRVEFKEVGDKTKFGVHVKYNIETVGWTYFECFREKERRQYELGARLKTCFSNLQATVIFMRQTDLQVPNNSNPLVS